MIKSDIDKPFSSTLLPRKKYNLSGYSSDSDCCNKQFDQLSSAPKRNNRINRNQMPSIPTYFQEVKTYRHQDHNNNSRNNLECERLLQMNNRMNRFKSIERQHVNKQHHYPANTITYNANRPVHEFNPSTENVSHQKFTLSSNQLANEINNSSTKTNTKTSSTTNSNNPDTDLIKNMNDYFLKWKTFNYDPMETSDQDLTQDNTTNMLISNINNGLKNISLPINQEISSVSSTLPRFFDIFNY